MSPPWSALIEVIAALDERLGGYAPSENAEHLTEKKRSTYI